MSSSLIIGISGKKQAGKTSLCNFIEAIIKQKEYAEAGVIASFEQDAEGNVKWDDEHLTNQPVSSSVKVYSFADRLKEDLCIKLLGLSREQVYGTDEQKNTFTKYSWDKMPQDIAFAYSSEMAEVEKFSQYEEDCSICYETQLIQVPRTGFMTAREVMQVAGTDLMRKMFDENIWVNATFNLIEQEKPQIALISDVRFRTEVAEIISRGGYIIRLDRAISADTHSSEIDLDGYDWSQHGGRTLVVRNDEMTIDEKNNVVRQWLNL